MLALDCSWHAYDANWWKMVVSLLILCFSICPEKVKRPSNFVDFYSYAFRYCLTGIMILWGTMFNLETWFLFFPYFNSIFVHFQPSVIIVRGEAKEHWYREHMRIIGSCFRLPISGTSWLVCRVFKGEWMPLWFSIFFFLCFFFLFII